MVEVDVVNKEDEVIKQIEESKRDREKDIIRCSLVFLTHDSGKVFLQLRSKEESDFPGCWDATAGGGLHSGETYREGAKREMKEEIGIETGLERIGKELFEYQDGSKEFVTVFKGEISEESFEMGGEVDKVEAFSKEELKEMIDSRENFHPECVHFLDRYLL